MFPHVSTTIIVTSICKLCLRVNVEMFQITNEQIQNWSADPDKFAEEEDEDTFAYGVRISSLDVLQVRFVGSKLMSNKIMV